MDNVKPMVRPSPPDEGLVRLLESLMGDAKSGRLLSLSFFGEMLGGDTVTGTGGTIHRMADHLFAYEMLKTRLLMDS